MGGPVRLRILVLGLSVIIASELVLWVGVILVGL